MLRKIGIIAVLSLIVAALAAVPALAQSGHFLDRTVQCTDIGTQVQCTGKVAGLGGTTFAITVDAADAIASVECTNPGGNVAPGQDTTVDVQGTSGELLTPRNGNFNFTQTTDDPEPLPRTPTCPNNSWTPNIVDLTFTDATVTLTEDGVVSDTITVAVNPES
jgi:hypothetical protein